MHQHAKLIATKTADHIAVAHRASQPLGQHSQNPISGEVTAGVVDLLEAVEIHHHNTCAASVRHHLVVHCPLERGAVQQPGERIMVGLMAELHRLLLFGRKRQLGAALGFNALGDISHVDDQTTHVTVVAAVAYSNLHHPPVARSVRHPDFGGGGGVVGLDRQRHHVCEQAAIVGVYQRFQLRAQQRTRLVAEHTADRRTHVVHGGSGVHYCGDIG